MIYTAFEMPGDGDYFIIGKRQDNVWVKYIDIPDITKRYFGKNRLISYSHPVIKNDTIIFEHSMINQKPGGRLEFVKAGEFRFKWDDAAQWFGVEQVVY